MKDKALLKYIRECNQKYMDTIHEAVLGYVNTHKRVEDGHILVDFDGRGLFAHIDNPDALNQLSMMVCSVAMQTIARETMEEVVAHCDISEEDDKPTGATAMSSKFGKPTIH